MPGKKIVYLTPSLYIAGGVERVLTTHVNWLVEHTDNEVIIVLTDGAGKPNYYTLSPKVRVVNLDINFEVLWHLPIWKKAMVYLRLQRKYKKELGAFLLREKADITVSLLRREINFITSIPDGSKKIGWLHVNRKNYRNFEQNESNILKNLFAKIWMGGLVAKLKKLDRFVVLTDEDRKNWAEVDNVQVIANPLPEMPDTKSTLESKKVIAVGRYAYQKGFDLLLQAWQIVNQKFPDWTLDIYGSGDRAGYIRQAEELGILKSVNINEPVTNISEKYSDSSLFVLSSRFEGFGMVIIEAMNCGLPVVSFDCPCGPRDILGDNNEYGLLAKTGDIAALAAGIIKMIENPDILRDYSVKSLKRAQDFSIESVMKKWCSLYLNL